MDALECLFTRRSIRKYLDKPVEWDKIVDILTAARFAPSAGNIQNWKFVVIRDDDKKVAISEACYNQEWMKFAGAHIIVFGEPPKAKRYYGLRGERLYTIQSCAAATENILLAAHALGLGSCWVSAFDDTKMSDLFNLPEDVVPMVVVTIGYAAEEAVAPPKNHLDTITYLEGWGGRRKYAGMSWHSVNLENFVKSTKKIIKKHVDKVRKKLEEKGYGK